MNRYTANLYFLFIVISIVSSFTHTAFAEPIGGDETICARCCGLESEDFPSGTKPCTEQFGGAGLISTSLGTMGETQPISNAQAANGAGLGLSLNYVSYNADGEKASLNTVMGYGWSHSYNTLLFSQGRDLFKMSPSGFVTKYQRSGRTGPLKTASSAQQDIVENGDGSIEITNREGGNVYRFEKIANNPIRVAGTVPWMLTKITDRNQYSTTLTYAGGLLVSVEDAFGRKIILEYQNNRLVRIKDPLHTQANSRITYLSYDSANNLIAIKDPEKFTVTYNYNVRHQLIRKVDKNGHRWNYQYNSSGKPVAILDGNNQRVLSLTNDRDWATDATELTLNKQRRYVTDPSTKEAITTRTDGNGKIWKHHYDRNGMIRRIIAPDRAETSYTYDDVYDPANGRFATLNVATETDANNHTTTYFYDIYGNRTKMVDANDNVTEYEYEVRTLPPYDLLKRITYPNGSITEYQYDVNGNRIQEIRDVGGLNLRTDWSYYVSGAPESGNPSGLKGLLKTQTVHNGAIPQITQYEYDEFGNQNKVTDPEGHVTRYVYDKLGNRLKMIDGNGHEWTYAYDQLDRLIQETDPLGYVTAYDYDGVGNRIELRKQATKTPDTFQITRYEYDLRNRLIKETRDPGGLNLVTAYTYDNNDNRKTVTDPRNKTTSFDYDLQNRMSKVTDALGNQTQYAYDPVGNRIQETDANGHKSCSQFDALNRLTVQIRKMGDTSCTLTAANDIVTQHFYDSGAAMACDHEPGSPSCNGPTPGSSNIAHTIDPEGKHSYFKYDKVDRRWITIRKVTDSADACDGDDWCEFTKYDPVNNLIARIDANGNRTNYSYFANNWLKTETTDPGGLNLNAATTYDGVGNPKTVTNPRGNVITNTYDARNQLLLVVDSIGKIAEYQYDGIGNRIVERDGNQGDTDPFTADTPPVPETRYAYDAVNRLISTIDPMGNSNSNAYDKNGNLIKVTDRENHVSCHYYDDINRRTRTAQLMGGSNCAVLAAGDLWTDTEYDAVGNVTRLLTAKHNATPAACAGSSPPADCESTAYQYDPADRLVLENYADGTTRQFAYDKAGNLTQRTDQLGQVTKYGYNDLYYLRERNYQDPAELDDFFDYDTGGRMLLAERGAWMVRFDAYDAANRLLQTTQDATGLAMTLQYAHDTAAGTRAVIYPGGRLCNEQRDLRERLVGSTCDSFNAQYAYDQGNRVNTRNYNNGVSAHYSYDADNRITALNHTAGGTILDFGYDYDKEGNKQFEQKNHDPAKSEAYTYDDVYRLIDYKVGELVGSTVQVPTTQHEYDLDKVGNWDQFKINGVAFKNTPNQMNEYDDPSSDGPGEIPDDNGIPNDFKDLVATPEPDGENWAHDKNGNRREDGKRIYVYDDENRLIQVTRKSDALVSEYQYDALSRRAVKTVGVGGASPITTRYAYDDARIVEEQNGTAATEATYVYGNYIDEVLNMQRGGADYYYHQNALWTMAAVTNAAGVVVEKYAYSDYGCPSLTHSAIGNPWLFTGRQWDEESGLYFYRARYYDCEGGRFLQRDQKGYIGGQNMYIAYFVPNKLDPSGNNPVVLTFIKELGNYSA
jgi:RHS repeat-associated core domain